MRELEAEDIYRELAMYQEPTADLISRRQFLKLLGAGVAVSSIPLGLWERTQAEALGASDGILVVIFLAGGNDGLNTVAPMNNGKYHDLRKNVALKPAEALPLSGGYAMHPSLKNMQALYKKGKVAVIQGVYYQKPDLSHFSSMAFQMGGWAPGGSPKSGWLGRYLDGVDGKLGLGGVTIGSGVPLHMQGSKGRTSAFPQDKWQLFGAKPEWQKAADSEDLRLYKGLKAMSVPQTGRGQLANYVSTTGARALAVAEPVAACYPKETNWDNGELARHMTVAANIINANMSRVVSVQQGGYDTHDGQDWKHKDLLTQFDNAIGTFYQTLKPAMAKRVTILTFSEFGRRAEANGNGTDHGTANSWFLIGDNVRGGILGQPPSLTSLDSTGNLKPTTSVYQVYSTIAEKWLGADGKEVVGKTMPALPLFKKAPGQA